MRKLFLILAVLLITAFVAAPQAMAVGTLAGTAISNQAYGDYKDANGNPMARVVSNIVSVTVSQVYGVAIVPPTASQSGKSGDKLYYLVQLFNTGNGNDEQTFSYASGGAWTPSDVKMYYDVNNNHTYDAGTDVLLTETSTGSKTYKTVTTGGVPVPILPDDDYDLIMEVTVPAGTTDNTTNTITILTTSDGDGSKQATGTYTTTVLAASILAAKTHTPLGAPGSPTYLKPGDTVTYTIMLSNSGTSVTATGVSLNDPLPSNVTYVANSLKINVNGAGFVAKSDTANDDGVKYDSGTKAIIAPDGATTLSIPALQNWAVQFQATVNAGTSYPGSVVNQATVTYSSGTSTVTIQTNGDTCLIAQLAAIDLNSTAPAVTANPGDVVSYLFNAVNNGNAADTINLVPSSTMGWTWTIYADTNGNGVWDAGDALLTDTNGDTKLDTGSLVQNGSISLLAVATVPAGSANLAQDTVTIAGSSAFDLTKTDTLSFTTTVKAPSLTINKGLTYVQAPGAGATCTVTNPLTGGGCFVFPGSTLTYLLTVTNSGSGTATLVTLTDVLPTTTTFVSGSLKTGASIGSLNTRTDTNTDTDGAGYNSGTHSVEGDTPSLGAGGTFLLQYQSTVN